MEECAFMLWMDEPTDWNGFAHTHIIICALPPQTSTGARMQLSLQRARDQGGTYLWEVSKICAICALQHIRCNGQWITVYLGVPWVTEFVVDVLNKTRINKRNEVLLYVIAFTTRDLELTCASKR
jgi:hypothetical protein